jgi:hypothetical protein
MTCKTPKAEPGDWSRFEFRRWGLDGVPAGEAGEVLGALAEKLFASPEWQGQMAASLPDLRSRVAEYFDARGRDLEARKRDQEQEVETRVASIDRARSAMQDSINAAAAPPRLTPDPQSYQVAARVTDEASGLGLPGLNVLLLDPKGGAPVAESPTDLDGNAVIAIPRERAVELAGHDLTLQVATAQGKVVQKVDRAVCPRLGNVETWVGSIKAGRTLGPLVAAAEERRSGQAARLDAMAERARLVRSDHERWRKEVDCDVDVVHAVIADIKKETAAGRRGEKARARKRDSAKKPRA